MKHILLEFLGALSNKKRGENQGFGEIKSLFIGVNGAHPL